MLWRRLAVEGLSLYSVVNEEIGAIRPISSTKVDESEPEGTRYVKTAGADGRSVTVHRTVRDRAGNVLHEEDFTSNYAPIDEVWDS